ncbi:MAG: peptidoglycan DD-metalloendopeptidase family protein [Pseudomonadota bacterium]
MATMLIAGVEAVADEPGLVFPVDCALGETCFIQQYVDRDPGNGALDYTCGPLSYDDHKGTDIRVADRKAMSVGVDVLSATHGRVVALRDGMADRSQLDQDAPDVTDRECGNGLIVERADGWRFQYCHLARGSLAVSEGEQVTQGQRLGQIGLSGLTEFPHLHFQVRDQAGRIIDPFDAREQNESCRFSERATLWAHLDPNTDYQPGGALAAGMGPVTPEYNAIRAGVAHNATLPTEAEAIVFWAHFFGLREGDEITLQLFDQSGALLVEQSHLMPHNRATQFRAVGRRAEVAWPAGMYRGQAKLMRDGRTVDSISADVEVR